MRGYFARLSVSAGIAYLFVIAYLLFFAPFRTDTLTEVNLIPFKVLLTEIGSIFYGDPSTEYIFFILGGIIGNILLLMPIPILFKLKWPAVIQWLMIFLLPICIESLQYAFLVGSADIDDVLLNSLGCWIGFKLSKQF